MFSDPNQHNPLEGGSQIYYDYLDSVSVREICSEIETLEYIVNSGRYDEKREI